MGTQGTTEQETQGTAEIPAERSPETSRQVEKTGDRLVSLEELRGQNPGCLPRGSIRWWTWSAPLRHAAMEHTGLLAGHVSAASRTFSQQLTASPFSLSLPRGVETLLVRAWRQTHWVKGCRASQGASRSPGLCRISPSTAGATGVASGARQPALKPPLWRVLAV